MTIDIYYFTGTVILWAVARDIAEKAKEPYYPFHPHSEAKIRTEADTIGIVFPVI